MSGKNEGRTVINIIKARIRINVERDGDEFYAYCPQLQGVHVSGETLEEALNNAKDAANAYLDSTITNGDPLPLCVDCYTPSEAVKHLFNKLTKRETSVVQDLDIAIAN